MIVRVQAFSRLHFGLMEICPGQPHCYGGVGMMISSPSMLVQGLAGSIADPSSVRIEGDGYWSERTSRVLEIWRRQHPDSRLPIESIRVVRPPQAHIGLGSGTQWACSIAGLLQIASRTRDHGASVSSVAGELFSSAESLAAHAGRGLRSHIGCEGFRRGGLIVDWGQRHPETLAGGHGRTEVFSFPASWRMVTRCDRSYQGESGGSEATMFERCSSLPNPLRGAMVRMLREEMLPAFDASDWVVASDAIGRYGEWAGRIFEPLQGGVYRSPAIAESIADLRSRGIRGVGQSSWGPTVFALARDPEQAEWIADGWRNRSSGDAAVEIARVAPAAVYEGDSSS